MEKLCQATSHWIRKPIIWSSWCWNRLFIFSEIKLAINKLYSLLRLPYNNVRYWHKFFLSKVHIDKLYIYITPSAISLYFLMVINIRKHGQGKHIRIRQTHNLSLVVLWYSHWNVNNQWIVEAFSLFNSSHLLCSNSASGN